MTRAIVLAALTVLAGCSGATDPTTPPAAALAGTAWVQQGYDEARDALVLTAVDRLQGEVIGYAFGWDGVLTYRSFGWCATPPLTFFDVEGTWRPLPAAHLELSYPGMLPESPVVYEVVQRTATALLLRPVPPVDQE